ncbi:hypothetical protein RND81_05G246200 [Saponaria officinalis]|uniref:DNA-directed RNA polymerase I subunit rpa49 n=1 Tax=Saponaria officinalis TaxID=3572 RepID=A0AAW1KW45_SAPOF
METQSNPQETPYTHKKKKQKSGKLSGEIDTVIQVINEEQGKTPPIVGYFPSGIDPINKNKSNNLTAVNTLRNQKKPRRIELVVKPHGCRVDYVGTNYSGEAAAGKLGVNRLALVDKVSGTIQFIPIVSGKVFRLEPKVSRSDKSGEEPATPVKTELTNVEMKEKLGNLTAQYGTSAALKKARKAQQLNELDDPDSRQELNQILELTKVDKKAIESVNTNTNRNIPPHDVSANTPANAYPLNKIIHSGELDYVNDILQLLQAGEELKPDVYPTFVCNRSHKVVLLKDEEEKRKVAGILSYITHLVNFKNKHSLDGFASSKHHKIPSMLLQKFTKMFLNTDKMRIADDKVEAILSYVLVLTLHIDEFESDFTDIAKDLKMSALSLRPYLENLGCKFRSRNRVTVATLPVPLAFPSARRKRRRG